MQPNCFPDAEYRQSQCESVRCFYDLMLWCRCRCRSVLILWRCLKLLWWCRFWCWWWRSGTFWFFDSFCDAVLMLQVVVRNSLILLRLLWRCFDAGCCRGDIRDDGYRNRITLDLKIHWQWRFRHCQCLLEAAAEEMELLHQAADGVHMWGHM